MAKATTTRSTRAKARLARLRRDPGGRVSLEIARYLETVGWRAVVSGPLQVRGAEQHGLGRYEFVMSFTGGRRRDEAR